MSRVSRQVNGCKRYLKFSLRAADFLFEACTELEFEADLRSTY